MRPSINLIYNHNLTGRMFNPRTAAALVSQSSRNTFATSPSSFGKLVNRPRKGEKKNIFLRAGLPFIFFSILASWVVKNAVEGKLKEREVSQGTVSRSLRQAKMEEEREEMMERLAKISSQDFDNTKRIKRPHEILEERRKERERRNAWHRRAYRYFFGDKDQQQ